MSKVIFSLFITYSFFVYGQKTAADSIIIEKQIQEVEIVGKKKLIERKIDRLVFNVENSTTSIGGDALDALRTTPGVRIQNDQISMVGKSGMSVMVDDRIILLSGDDLVNFLRTLKSDNIKSIEVITSPPAKYDAEGNSGIINIKLKKAKADSWSNTIRTSAKQATYSSFNAGNNFTYQKNKLDLLFDVSASRDVNIYTNDINYFYPSENWVNKIYNKSEADRLSGIFNIKYNISKTFDIGFQYLGNSGILDKDEESAAQIFDISSLQLNRTLNAEGNTRNKSNNHSFNLNMLKKLDTLGKRLSVDLDYFTFNANKGNTFNSLDFDRTINSILLERTDNNNEQKINNFSGKVDFDMPFKWANISFGGKISFTETKNNIDINRYNVTSPISSLISGQSDEFIYSENIQALYISANRKFSEKWEGKVGLRAESTQNEGYSKMFNETNTNDYIKLFPTFYLAYHANEENSIVLSYSRRVNRPSYSNLNPARWYLTSNSYEEGNPFLQPSFTSNLELSHTLKDLLTTTISFSKTSDGFGQITTHDLENNVQSFIRRNYFDYSNFLWSEYINYNIFPWWNTSAEASVYYTETRAYSEFLNPKYSGWGGYFSNNNNFTLNKKKTISAQLVYEYNYPTIFNENRSDAYSNLGIGVKFLCLDKQLQIALTANNILGSDRVKTSNITQGISQNFRQYYDTQFVRLSLSYKFGNKNLNLGKKTTSNEDEKTRSY